MAKVLGRRRLYRKLEMLRKVTIDHVRRAMEKSADEIVALMRAAVPVDKGDLRDSIGWTWGDIPGGSKGLFGITGRKKSATLRITIYAGGGEAFHARWVEFGVAPHKAGGMYAGADHPGSAAQPFFYSSFYLRREKTKRRIEKAAREAAHAVARL